jgi:hypothetical protein
MAGKPADSARAEASLGVDVKAGRRDPVGGLGDMAARPAKAAIADGSVAAYSGIVSWHSGPRWAQAARHPAVVGAGITQAGIETAVVASAARGSGVN